MELTTTQKRQRLLTMIFGAIAIFFTGYPHVWSIYQPYVMEQAGWSQTAVWIGGDIFAIGILASAFLIVPSSLPMYVTYGVMQGFGQGLIYTVIISTVQKWFPGRTGFASGVVVTANGLCGFFLAPISRRILQAEGPGKTFLIIGAAITISWILCGIFFTAPDKEWRRKAERALREQNVANGNAEAQTEQIRRDDEDKELLSSSGDDAVWADFLFPGVTGITDISD